MKVVVAITGASGIAYGVRLCQELSRQKGVQLDIVVSDGAKLVMDYEMAGRKKTMASLAKCAKVWDEDAVFAPFASGSNAPDAFIVCPCSMKTLAAIAHGYSHNLITRGAEVALKERKKLVILPREMPISTIQLENMYRLSLAGAVIMPPQPAFYNEPKDLDDIINFIVGKVLDSIGIKSTLYKRWDSK
ncbi:MAG: UbiX family flavin prenyltransferase [Candidatus Micrarchaeia archaeon]